MPLGDLPGAEERAKTAGSELGDEEGDAYRDDPFGAWNTQNDAPQADPFEMGPVEVGGVVASGDCGDDREGCGNGDHSSGHGEGVIGGWRSAEEDEDSGEDVGKFVDGEELVEEEDADLSKAR